MTPVRNFLTETLSVLWEGYMKEAILDNFLSSYTSTLSFIYFLHCNIKLYHHYFLSLGTEHFLCTMPSFHG